MVAVGLAAGWLAARPARAAELSADEIVARNVAARGGLDAWRKVGTMVWVGHVESARAPVPGMQFTLEQKRPNKTRLQLNASGEKSLRVFDGVHGWKVRSTGGQPQVQPYTPQEVMYARAGHGIDGPLIDHAAKGSSVTLEGLDEIGTRKAYRLSVHLASGGTEQVWVDAETWLDVRYDRTADAPAGGTRRVSTTFADYRNVEGLQIPFLIETGGGPSAAPDKLRIERVLLNAPVDDASFGIPGPRAPGRSRRSSANRPRAPATLPAPQAAPNPGGSAPP